MTNRGSGGTMLPTRNAGSDASNGIVLYLVVLMGIPAGLVVGGLGAAGTPAQIIGVAFFGWYIAGQLLGAQASPRRNPIHWLLAIFAVALMTSYVVGMSRTLLGAEASSADRGMISLASWCGVVLVISAGIGSRQRASRVIAVLAGGGVAIAALGMLQFATGFDLAARIHIPGLHANSVLAPDFDRSGFRRVSGTTSHPIEFGVVLAALLPLALHQARFALAAKARRWWWIGTGVIAAVIPMSISRSGVIGAAIVFLVLAPTWPAALRRKIIVAGVFGALAMSVVVPGLLGTLRSLFLNISGDPSAQGRTDDYGPAFDYVGQHPWFGRGFGTFIPSLYRTLDNQYLGLLIEAGIFGLAALLLLLAGTACIAFYLRTVIRDDDHRDLAQCLIAGIAVIAVNSATFDSFGFAMATGLLFVFIGLVGWLWRMHAPEPAAAPPRRGWRRPPGPMRVVVGILLFAWIAGAFAMVTAKDGYRTSAYMLLVGPEDTSLPLFASSGHADVTASVLHDVMVDQPARDRILGAHPGNYGMAVGQGSVMNGTDVLGFGPQLSLSAEASTYEGATDLMAALISDTEARLQAMQSDAGVAGSVRITARSSVEAPVLVAGKASRMALGMFGLTVMLLVAIVVAWRRASPQPQRTSSSRSAVAAKGGTKQ